VWLIYLLDILTGKAMKNMHSYGDERTLAFCAFCGGETGTRDHCPSRIFLDEPYPENLPVVPACSTCNSTFSADEEYLACLVSCVTVGSTDPATLPREKTRRILNNKPLLRARIEQTRSVFDGTTIFKAERERVEAVITKLAQGHSLYELHVSCINNPDEIKFMPLSLMNKDQREEFEYPEVARMWPEVGSRRMQRLVTGTDLTAYGWIDVQHGRYRFHASVGNVVDVRIVIHEYLACHIRWSTLI